MLNRFQVLIVAMSLFQLIAVVQDKKCSVVPAKSVAIVNNKRELTCYAEPGTMILSWKSGLESVSANYTIISSLGVLGLSESMSRMQNTEGYVTEYFSLRKSTMRITRVTLQQAGSFFCFVLNIVSQTIQYCESKLNVFQDRPQFYSNRIDLVEGIITNLLCAVIFKGSGILHMQILDGYSAVPRNTTKATFTDFSLHVFTLKYYQKVNITMDKGNYIVSPDLGVRSAFQCITTLEDGDGYKFTVDCEVDAPVTRVSIVPHSATKCSERSCSIHEKLMCISDGKPKPFIYQWSLALEYGHFKALHETTPYLYASISGRNTFECRVFNEIENRSFTASGRFTTHVEAYEWVLDKYATYKSKGSRHKAWCRLTIVAAAAGIIWVFMPFCRQYYCHV